MALRVTSYLMLMGQESVKRGRRKCYVAGELYFSKVNLMIVRHGEENKKTTVGFCSGTKFLGSVSTPWIHPPEMELPVGSYFYIHVLGREDLRSCPVKCPSVTTTALVRWLCVHNRRLPGVVRSTGRLFPNSSCASC